jgi:nicotinamide mononucleotide transporter
MSLPELWHQLITGIQNTTRLEFVGVITGIASVFFSSRESIWVYPVGLVSTVIYTYLSFAYHLPGEASVNIYYTIMSVYGWWFWGSHNSRQQPIAHITYSTASQWLWQLCFFAGMYVVLFAGITYFKQAFAPGAIPWADAFAAAAAYTGMLLMARKKIEHWYWWMVTNTASIPLYFVKGLVFSSVQFLVLLVMAVVGLLNWKHKTAHAKH